MGTAAPCLCNSEPVVERILDGVLRTYRIGP